MCERKVLHILIYTLLSVIYLVNGARLERMLIAKMQKSDLETSGSGYAYAHQQGLPASYIRYTNHGGRVYWDAPQPVNFAAPPVAEQQRELANLLYPQLGVPGLGAYGPALGQSLAGVGIPQPAAYVIEQPRSVQNFEHADDEDKAKENSSESEEIQDSAPYAGHDDAYVNDAGETYDTAKYSAHGSKGETGYEKHNEFDEGESGSHLEDNHKEHYNDEGGHEKARSETAGHYAQHGEEEKGAKGANYGQVKYHKKGHKTSGFHNVYHKDEYKKDTDFYDEEHESGNFEKYGSNDEQHKNVEGAVKKGLRHDSAYQRKAHASEGRVDKGRNHKHRQGHSHKKGEDNHHRKESEYSKAENNRYNKEFGHHDKRGFHD